MDRNLKNLFYNLPHPVIYYGTRLILNKKHKHLQSLRTREAGKNGYSMRGFDDLKCIFIHIPKTGGVSLSHGFFGNLGGGHRRIVDYYPIFSPKEFKEYFKFAIVRNPWDRVVSAYFFLKGGGFHETERKWVEENISVFEDFEEFICRWVNEQNIYSYKHFIPQHHFVLHKGKLMIDKFYKLENISSAVKEINSRLNVNITLPHKNRNLSRNPDYRQYYNKKTKKIIEDIYSKDIQIFNYSF